MAAEVLLGGLKSLNIRTEWKRRARLAFEIGMAGRGDNMFSAFLVAITAATAIGSDRDEPRLIRGGGDPARGILVNYSSGVRPFDPPDRSLPTVVFVHGFNPLPQIVHFEMAQEFAHALRRRGNPAINLLAWDWNAATFDSPNPSVNSEAAVCQGQALARSLEANGIDPGRTHLIGHSAGGMVVTSAARVLAIDKGRRVAQITLLDPATYYHAIIFERLEAGSLAPIVENYWCPGPSAYGREVALPGVRNVMVEGPSSYFGVICPLRSDHLFVVRWYLETVEDPRRTWGFNTSSVVVDRIR